MHTPFAFLAPLMIISYLVYFHWRARYYCPTGESRAVVILIVYQDGDVGRRCSSLWLWCSVTGRDDQGVVIDAFTIENHLGGDNATVINRKGWKNNVNTIKFQVAKM